MIRDHATELVQFRKTVYQNLNNRADTVMELIDALCSSVGAQSPDELTLAPSFRRTYSTMYKAIDEFKWDKLQLARLLASYLPLPIARQMIRMDTPPHADDPWSYSHLFTVRVWYELLEEDDWEVRMQAKRILTGETRCFREWSLLADYLVNKLAIPHIEG